MSIYLVEIEAYEGTLLFCTGSGYITKPTDTPPNTVYTPRVKQAGSVKSEMFKQGASSGSVSMGYGEITLMNLDGELDYLADWGFDGRYVTVRKGLENGSYPSDYPVLYRTTIEQPAFERAVVSLRLRDMMFMLNKPLQTAKFLGNNVLPEGFEGTELDLKGKPKPVTLGKVFNATAVCVNTSKLIYALNLKNSGLLDSIEDFDSISDFDTAGSTAPVLTGITIYNVFDKGVPLTKGPDYTTEEDFITYTPSSSQFRVYPISGMFRLGSVPVGAVTADCMNLLAETTPPTVANTAKRVLIEHAGLTESEIDLDDVTSLNAANSATVGQYITDEVHISEVLNRLFLSVGAWWGFDRFAIFRMFQIKLLDDATPVVYLKEENMSSFERLGVADTANGIPIKRLVLRWRKNYTIQQPADLAGSVTLDRKYALGMEFRETDDKDDSVLIKHKLAGEMSIDTCFYDEPITEVTRQFEIYKTRRDRFKCTIPLNITGSEELLTLGTIVHVTHSRFGYQNGKKFMVIGFVLDCLRNNVEVTLWG